jgi:hypothetical protein
MKTFLYFMTSLLLLLSGCKTDPSNLKQVQQQRSGDYTVTILSDTGTMKQGSSKFALEFRNADNKLVDVGKVEVSPVMEMSGMAPMMGGAEVTSTDTPGRYEVKGSLSMAGLWKVNVRFGDNRNVRFSLNAE